MKVLVAKNLNFKGEISQQEINVKKSNSKVKFK